MTEFVAHDRLHPRISEIDAMWSYLNKELKDHGYVAVCTLVETKEAAFLLPIFGRFYLQKLLSAVFPSQIFTT